MLGMDYSQAWDEILSRIAGTRRVIELSEVFFH